MVLKDGRVNRWSTQREFRELEREVREKAEICDSLPHRTVFTLISR
jgi:hypothetical protein